MARFFHYQGLSRSRGRGRRPSGTRRSDRKPSLRTVHWTTNCPSKHRPHNLFVLCSHFPQIRRLKPEAYKATKHISLVSSFMPSLFLGRIAPIEVSDASGMNLMDVLSCKWNDQLLEACGGPELRSKLGPEPVPGGTVLGQIHNWWVQRWGFSPGKSFIHYRMKKS